MRASRPRDGYNPAPRAPRGGPAPRYENPPIDLTGSPPAMSEARPHPIARGIAAAIAGLGLALPAPALAEVKPNGLFQDGMVLQRDRDVPVWGTADPGEKVAVSFRDQSVEAQAGPDGKWRATLKPLKAGGGPEALKIGGREIKDVLVGDVWLCSGQSNMQWPMSACDNSEAIANAKDDQIRFFTVPRRGTPAPEPDVPGKWEHCAPESAKDFSAVAYYFGRDLRKALDVPIGLIGTNYGGTPAEAWTTKEALDSYPDLGHYAAAADTEKLKAIPAERLPHAPAALSNAMIRPLVPFAIRGAIWYQGESNAGRAYEYRTLFPAMIRDWRTLWGQGDFPFLFVQLAPFKAIQPAPGDSDWAELREAQLLTTKVVPNSAMAVITDVGDEKDIHPKQKEPVGSRLALAALALSHGKDVAYSGPTYKEATFGGGKAVVSFKHVGKGLVAKGGPLTGFAIAGRDGKFVAAEAKIDGKTVVVSSPQVPEPVAVRFGWADFPVVNFWNEDGLPASPFRTDDAQGVTRRKH